MKGIKMKKIKSSRVLEIGNIFQRFMDKHKNLECVGSGFWINNTNEFERDLEINYKGKEYIITIAEVERNI
jgi:hypothetical protein